MLADRKGEFFEIVRWATDTEVPGKGRMRHDDHATITLHDWHRVLMNTEGQSKAMRNVAFLD